MLRTLLGTGSTLQHHSHVATVARYRRNLHSNIPFQIQIGTPRRAAGLLHVQPPTKIPRNTTILGISQFHSTSRRQAAPIVPFLLGALKVRLLFFSILTLAFL